MSIASALTALQGDITAARAAVTAKGGTVTSGGGSSQLAEDIGTIPSGGRIEAESKFIDFYDYDGFRVASWSKEELAAATELPQNPSHLDHGLVAQGWNWTLAGLKAQGTEMDVGQHYTTIDNKTWIRISIPDVIDRSLWKIRCWLTLINRNPVEIDWGDGTPTTTVTSSGVAAYHQYESPGDYIIKQWCPNGGLYSVEGNIGTSFIGDIRAGSPDHPFVLYVKEINLGTHITKLGAYAIHQLYALTTMSVPKDFVGNLPYTTLRYITFSRDSEISRGTSRNSIIRTTLSFAEGFKYFGLELTTSLSRLCIPDSAETLRNWCFRSTYLDSGCLRIPARISNISGNSSFAVNYVKKFRFEPISPPVTSHTNSFGGSNYSTVVLFLFPWESTAYLYATNYPTTTQPFIGFGTFPEGRDLPTQIAEYYTQWYENDLDASQEVNPITVGNGKEVYCRYTEVTA